MKEVDFSKEYNSYSGCDMIATMNIANVGPMVLGSLQTISVSVHQDKRPVRAISNINAKGYTLGQRTIAGTLVFATFNKHIVEEIKCKIKMEKHILSDELFPFDISIVFANEYGCDSRMAIYGIHLVNEGTVMSANDLLTENTYQYYAMDIDYIDIEGGFNSNGSNSANDNKISEKKDKAVQTAYSIDENKSKDIILQVTTGSTDTNGKTNAIFSLTPENTKDGKIIINNTSKTEEYKIPIDGSNKYTIRLPIENYIAYYENTDKKSNEVSFHTSNINLSNNTDIPIPYVKSVSENSASLSMRGDDCIVKDPKGGIIKTVKLSSRDLLLNDLVEGMEYDICAKENGIESMPVRIKPCRSPEIESEGFFQYVDDNKQLLHSTTVDIEKIENLIFKMIKGKVKIINFIETVFEFLLSIRNEENSTAIDDCLYLSCRYDNRLRNRLNPSYPEIEESTNAINMQYIKDYSIDNIKIYPKGKKDYKCYKNIPLEEMVVKNDMTEFNFVPSEKTLYEIDSFKNNALCSSKLYYAPDESYSIEENKRNQEHNENMTSKIEIEKSRLKGYVDNLEIENGVPQTINDKSKLKGYAESLEIDDKVESDKIELKRYTENLETQDDVKEECIETPGTKAETIALIAEMRTIHPTEELFDPPLLSIFEDDVAINIDDIIKYKDIKYKTMKLCFSESGNLRQKYKIQLPNDQNIQQTLNKNEEVLFL